MPLTQGDVEMRRVRLGRDYKLSGDGTLSVSENYEEALVSRHKSSSRNKYLLHAIKPSDLIGSREDKYVVQSPQ